MLWLRGGTWIAYSLECRIRGVQMQKSIFAAFAAIQLLVAPFLAQAADEIAPPPEAYCAAQSGSMWLYYEGSPLVGIDLSPSYGGLRPPPEGSKVPSDDEIRCILDKIFDLEDVDNYR